MSDETTTTTTAAPAADSGAAEPTFDVNATPAKTPEGRQKQISEMREALSTGQGVESLFGDDEPQEIEIPGLEAEEAYEDEEAEEGGEDEGTAALLTETRQQMDAMSQYYGAVYGALQTVQQQNALLTQQIQGYQEIDAQLAREGLERQRQELRPDPETDPEGHLQHLVQESVQQTADRIYREQQAQYQAQQAQAQEQAQQVQAQQISQTAQEDVRDALEQWPEFNQALNDYSQQAGNYYQSVYGMSAAQAHDAVLRVTWDAVYQAAARGESAADALYNMVDGAAYFEGEEETGEEAAEPDEAYVPGAQSFADRAEASLGPSSAAAVRPSTPEQEIQRLMAAAGNGDQQANMALLKHAHEIGDPRDPSFRRRLMQAFGEPM